MLFSMFLLSFCKLYAAPAIYLICLSTGKLTLHMKAPIPRLICINRFTYKVLIVNIKKKIFWAIQFPKMVQNIVVHKIRTSGDETCFYTTCSLAPVGDENMTVYLRYLTSIKLPACLELYASHPFPHVFNAKGASKIHIIYFK